jgi:hypothetical protein
MHTLVISLVLLALGAGILLPGPAHGQEAEQIRKELEQLRRLQEQNQRTIEALSERLRRLEARPPAPVTTPPTPAPATVVEAPSAPTPPSPMTLLAPRQPFSLYGQRGAGQLLFDMGVTGDFILSVAPHNVEKAGAGTFGSLENRFFPREVELNFFGQIDPFAFAEVRIEAGEEEPGPETSVSLAEATITLLALPAGLQAKLGQMRSRFGLTNVIHEHDLPFIDRPNVLRNFFGDEGLTEKGVELTWLPDLPFYLEGLVGVFNGDNETAFGYGRITQPLVTGRLRTFIEASDTGAIQLGISGAHGQTRERLGSTILGFDAKYKYRPDGWLHPLLTLSGEALYSIRSVDESSDVDVAIDTDGDGIPDSVETTTITSKSTRDAFGWYLHGAVQPFRRWELAARYDSSQFPDRPGYEWAIQPYVSFFPSEFLRFRLGYKHTERDRRSLFADNEATARIVDELLFQATFILGAHPAHPF